MKESRGLKTFGPFDGLWDKVRESVRSMTSDPISALY